MVSKAFVLINMEVGQGTALTDTLKGIPEITEIYAVYGVYDYLVRVETETMQHIKDIVQTKIKSLNYIKSTLTMIVVE